MMRNMKLSVAEKKGIRIEWDRGKQVSASDPQAIGKLFSEKPAIASAMAVALGRIWCPLKELLCKDLDDSLILMKVTPESSTHLQHVLQLYEVCSGQIVNVDKSSIMFSKNTRQADRAAMMASLGVSSETWNERYLGLLVYVGQSRSKVFAYLKDRIWKRIQGWMERMLSKVGKEILIKACAQAIPIFAMTCFDITKGLCDDINSMICRHWWAYQDNDHKMHWLSWDKLTLPKKEGGLGYKDLHAFNMAMLAKQAWRLLTDPSSLCGRVLKARYHPDMSVLMATPTEGISYSWRSILKGVDLLNMGVIKRVGDGSSINLWIDPWLPRNWCRKPITPRGQNVLTMVSELLDPASSTWDARLVDDTFGIQDAYLIKAIPVHEDIEDFWAWHPSPKGQFSVKSAYKLFREDREKPCSSGENSSPAISFSWSLIWNSPITPQAKMFLWLLAHNSLPLRWNILRRGIDIDALCPMCCRLNADGGHLFFNCKHVRALWKELKLEDFSVLLCYLFGGA
ncbi:hypothetical protein ACQ4PT_049496 [Festuca glaucescens]